MHSVIVFLCVVLAVMGPLTAQAHRGDGEKFGENENHEQHELSDRFGSNDGGRPNFRPILPILDIFGLFSRPPKRPAYIGVFQSNPAVACQTNMYELYSEAFSNPLLVNEVISLNISRNGSVYQLEETAIGSTSNTTIQSVSFELGVPAEVEIGGAVANVTVTARGKEQLVFSYNSTVSGVNGLTRLVLTAHDRFGGLNAEYRVGNTTGKRQFSRRHPF